VGVQRDQGDAIFFFAFLEKPEITEKETESIQFVAEVDNVVSRVVEAVSNAHDEIIATMHLGQEIEQPLPPAYHALLERKMGEGVALRRLGFGTEDEFATVQQMYPHSSENYSFVLQTDIDAYQRMIIVDRERLFFNSGGIFYTTTAKSLIDAFAQYFVDKTPQPITEEK
jgi:sugar-specific transcriptional regulator TrmB